MSSEKNNIHCDEEHNEDDQGQYGVGRREICKKHKGESKDDGREVLVNHIVRSRMAR